MLMHKSYINRISIGNIEDDISKISDVDWVIEVIIEDLEIKKILYSKLAEINTSPSQARPQAGPWAQVGLGPSPCDSQMALALALANL